MSAFKVMSWVRRRQDDNSKMEVIFPISLSHHLMCGNFFPAFTAEALLIVEFALRV